MIDKDDNEIHSDTQIAATLNSYFETAVKLINETFVLTENTGFTFGLICQYFHCRIHVELEAHSEGFFCFYFVLQYRVLRK